MIEKISYPKLKNAPIREAVIDIFYTVPNNFDLKQFDKIYEKFTNDFPIKEKKVAFEAQLKIDSNGQFENLPQRTKDLGFIYKNIDVTDVIQYRIDGFSFNKLKPYHNWDDLIHKSKRYYNLLIEGSPIQWIDSIGLRYINAIPFKNDSLNLSEILVDPPQLPSSLSASVTGILSRIDFKSNRDDSFGSFTMAIERAVSKHESYLLIDIEAKNHINEESNSGNIWEKFNQLRDLKNEVFFNIINAEKIKEFRDNVE